MSPMLSHPDPDRMLRSSLHPVFQIHVQVWLARSRLPGCCGREQCRFVSGYAVLNEPAFVSLRIGNSSQSDACCAAPKHGSSVGRKSERREEIVDAILRISLSDRCSKSASLIEPVCQA